MLFRSERASQTVEHRPIQILEHVRLDEPTWVVRLRLAIDAHNIEASGDVSMCPNAGTAEEVEKALHVGFDPNRINPKREFFRIEPDQAIAILKLFQTGEATREVTDQPSMVDQQSIAAAEQPRARCPNLDFEEMAIPMGTVLQSAHSDATVTVVATKKVRLADEETSPTAATRQVLGLDYSVQPGP